MTFCILLPSGFCWMLLPVQLRNHSCVTSTSVRGGASKHSRIAGASRLVQLSILVLRLLLLCAAISPQNNRRSNCSVGILEGGKGSPPLPQVRARGDLLPSVMAATLRVYQRKTCHPKAQSAFIASPARQFQRLDGRRRLDLERLDRGSAEGRQYLPTKATCRYSLSCYFLHPWQS